MKHKLLALLDKLFVKFNIAADNDFIYPSHYIETVVE